MSRIDSLVAAMTLTEKLGQMTMTTADSAVTGPVMTTNLNAGLESGEIGNLLNLYGADKVRAASAWRWKRAGSKFPCWWGWMSSMATALCSDSPGRSGAVRSDGLGSERAGSGERSRGRRHSPDLRADAGRGARPPLGPQRRKPRRRPFCRPGDGMGEGQRFSRRRPGRGGDPGGLRQALLRLWRGHGGTRICRHRCPRRAACAKSICHLSRPRWRPASPPSCRPLPTWTGYR